MTSNFRRQIGEIGETPTLTVAFLSISAISGTEATIPKAGRSSLAVKSHHPFHYFAPPPKNNFGTWIDVFKPRSQNIKTCILWNHLIDSNQVIHSDKDHQIPFAGGPNMRVTNPRWRTARAAILEKSINCHISVMVWPTDTKFGMGDTFRPSWPFRQLKCKISTINSRWRRPQSWKIEKSPHLSNGLTDRHDIW